MSDTRFTIIGIILIFAGFLILGVFGAEYFAVTIESQEFGDCYKYFDDKPPEPIDCTIKLQDKIMFFGLVIGLISAGVFSLIKGVRGKWDQDIKPEDMLGPGNSNKKNPENPD